MRSAAILTVLLLAGAILPLAAADHAYSHRFILYGRVIDAEGYPVQGITVSASVPPGLTEGDCSASHPPVTQRITNSKGDYFWCFHVHRIASETYKWTAKVENQTKDGPIDMDLRKARVDFELADPKPAQRGAASFNRTYSLTTTLWRPGETAIESISVEGTALTSRPVTAVFTYNGGKTKTVEATTNDYGDATFEVTFDEPLTNGSVVVNGPRGVSQSGALDTDFHASTVVLLYPEAPWYENSGLLGLAVILGAVVLGGVGFAVWRFTRPSGSVGKVGRRAR